MQEWRSFFVTISRFDYAKDHEMSTEKHITFQHYHHQARPVKLQSAARVPIITKIKIDKKTNIPSWSKGLFHSSSTTSKENNSSPFSTTPSGTNRLTPHLSSFNQLPSIVTIFDVADSMFPFVYLDSIEALFLRDGDISTLSLPYDELAEILKVVK